MSPLTRGPERRCPDDAYEELADATLDLLGFVPWSAEPEQEIVRIPDVPEPPEVWVLGIARRHGLRLLTQACCFLMVAPVLHVAGLEHVGHEAQQSVVSDALGQR